MYVDVHTHLNFPDFNADREEVIERARTAGVTYIINNGTNSSTNKTTLDLAKTYDCVKAALGIYPTECIREELKKVSVNWPGTVCDIESELRFIETQVSTLVAFGEVGMDFSYVKNKKVEEKQKELFSSFVSLSEKHKLPLIIHSRKAEREIIDMLMSSDAKAILHSFTGRHSLVKKAIDRGYLFSIPSAVVRNRQFQELVAKIPKEHILTETDAPYLGPVKEERNEPVNVINSVGTLAGIKKIDENDMRKQIFKNFKNIFKKGL